MSDTANSNSSSNKSNNYENTENKFKTLDINNIPTKSPKKQTNVIPENQTLLSKIVHYEFPKFNYKYSFLNKTAVFLHENNKGYIFATSISFTYLFHQFNILTIEKEFNGSFNSPNNLYNIRHSRHLKINSIMKSFFLLVGSCVAIFNFNKYFLPEKYKQKIQQKIEKDIELELKAEEERNKSIIINDIEYKPVYTNSDFENRYLSNFKNTNKNTNDVLSLNPDLKIKEHFRKRSEIKKNKENSNI